MNEHEQVLLRVIGLNQSEGSSQLTDVTMVPEKGNETLRTLEGDMGNSTQRTVPI